MCTEVGSGVSRLAGAGRTEKLFQFTAYFLSTGRVSSGIREPPCPPSAGLRLLLRLRLAAGLPVPLGGLAKCLKLHLNAVCSVLIRTRAESHPPLSCSWPHGIPYHVWYHFCYPTPASPLFPEIGRAQHQAPSHSCHIFTPPSLQTNGSQRQRYRRMSVWMLKRGTCKCIQ